MKKKIIITITIILSIVILTAGIGAVISAKKYRKMVNYDFDEFIKVITQNTKIIDANLDHNQAIDAADYAVTRDVEIPPVLINFDTHSDIYLNITVLNENGARIANWINEYFAKYPQADKLYWVMPREEALNPIMQFLFAIDDYSFSGKIDVMYGNSIKKLSPFKFMKTPLTEKAYEQILLLDPSTGIINEYADNKTYKAAKINFDNNDPKLRKIKIITCTEDTLPDFKGRKVLLSIDADYISNSGFDTTGNFINNKNQKQITYTIYSMIKTIKEKNIRPEIINLTLSPEYLPPEDHQQIINFYNKIFEITQLPDAVRDYKHKIDEHHLDNYEFYKKNPILYFLQI